MKSRLVAHGAALFLLGLASGVPFGIELLQRFELWPLPVSIPMDVPGDARGWKMAHLEGILNGLTLFAIAGTAHLLKFTSRGATMAWWGAVAAAWANTVASIIGPLTETRGLAFGGSWNSIVYLLFLIAVVGIVAAMIAILQAALRAGGDVRWADRR
jgi:hypothetical protein